MIRWFVAAGLLAACLGAQARVYGCVDAAGKTSYSDQPCTAAQRGGEVLGPGATEKRWEPEGYRLQEQLDSAARASALQRETGAVVRRQSEAPEGPQGPAGAVTMDAGRTSRTGQVRSQKAAPAADDEACETYSDRKGCIGGERARNPNWSARRGYNGGGGAADQRYEEQQRLRAASGPGPFVNCDSAGCWGSRNGVRYHRAAGGNLVGTDGQVCTSSAGTTYSCN